MRWLAGISLFVAGLAHGGMAGAAEPQVCAEYSMLSYCVEWEAGSAPTSDGGDSAAAMSTEVVCYWETIGPVPPLAVTSGFLPDAPTDTPLVWQRRVCTDGSQGDDPSLNVRWVEAPTVAPEDLAAAARARLADLLPPPELETSPPIGTAAIVGIPTFVAVGNWTGEVSESECGAGLCVRVTAMPELVFAPGEPGSAAKVCAGRGTRHRPGASLEQEAAAPGACVHAYARRTAVQGRPREWPGSVEVTWTISWTASTGASGSLPSVTRSSALPRAVEEVQAPVVGGDLP